MRNTKQYRLKDIEVSKLNLKPNPNNRFRLNKDLERQLLKLRETQETIKRLFFDIETSPNIVYSWRTGYNLTITTENIITERAIICISYK